MKYIGIMMKKFIVLTIMAILIFAFLMFFYFTPLEQVKKITLKTDRQKQSIKKYIQKKIGFELPSKFEPLKIASQHGKDTFIIVQFMLNDDNEESIDKFRTYLNNYEKMLSQSNEIEMMLSLIDCNTKQDNKKFYKLSNRNGSVVDILILATDDSNAYYIYFMVIDNVSSEILQSVLPGLNLPSSDQDFGEK